MTKPPSNASAHAPTQRHFFGTDGIRGVAGEAPLTAEFAFQVGIAAAEALRDAGKHAPSVLIGSDTRRSGPMLAYALSAGLASRGAEAVGLGVIPTPGVSYLARQLGADAGIVISASHNPYRDNGIKFFDARGEKLSDVLEADIESYLDKLDALTPVTGDAVGVVRRHNRLENSDYFDFLVAHGPDLSGLRIGLDCANGASYALAPEVFEALGADVHTICAEPDGININMDCGSTHPESIKQHVIRHTLDLGVTFDGDADRVLLVDRCGRLVSGDHMLAICALHRDERAVVSTIMGNLGLEHYLAERGVTLLRSAVGDRYVHELLRQEDLTLGGEQSGHLLFLDRAPTGDGILSALQTLAATQALDKPLETWVDDIPMYPQTLLNVPVEPSLKASLADHQSVRQAVEEAALRLEGQGRINLRPSGTEALVRVMVEGQDQDLIEAVAKDVASVVENAA